MPGRGSIPTAPGQGPPIDGYVLDDLSGLFVPSALLRGMRADGTPQDVAVSDAGEVRGESDWEAMFPPRSLQYARDVGDRMRVSLDAATAGLAAGANTIGYVALKMFDQAGNYQPWYNTNVGKSVDDREAYEQQTRMEFFQKRARWTIT